MKTKFNSDDDLPLEKQLKALLDDTLYELHI